MTDKNDEVDAVDEAEVSEMDQGDIDALLGDVGPDMERQFSCVEEEIIHRSMSNYEKLPMLDVITERLVMGMINSLKTHTSATADVTVKALEYKSYSEAMGEIVIPSLISVVKCQPWDGNIIISADAKLLYATLELMLGGRNSSPSKAEGRTFTSIERSIGTNLSKVVLNDLSKAFSQLTKVEFEITSNETNPQFATISQPNSPCVHIRLAVSLDSRKGSLDLVIPYATIEPVRKILSKVFLGEKLGGDDLWRTHISSLVSTSTMTMKAVLDEKKVPVKEVLKWKVGDTLDFQIEEDKECTVYCEGFPIFRGYMGKKHMSMAVRATEILNEKRAHDDDI